MNKQSSHFGDEYLETCLSEGLNKAFNGKECSLC